MLELWHVMGVFLIFSVGVLVYLRWDSKKTDKERGSEKSQ